MINFSKLLEGYQEFVKMNECLRFILKFLKQFASRKITAPYYRCITNYFVMFLIHLLGHFLLNVLFVPSEFFDYILERKIKGEVSLI